MFKLIVLALALAVTFNIIYLQDETVVIDTMQAKTVLKKSKSLLDENVEVK